MTRFQKHFGVNGLVLESCRQLLVHNKFAQANFDDDDDDDDGHYDDDDDDDDVVVRHRGCSWLCSLGRPMTQSSTLSPPSSSL